MVNLPARNQDVVSGRTSEKLAEIAGISEKTYRMGAKVLDSELVSQMILLTNHHKIVGEKNSFTQEALAKYIIESSFLINHKLQKSKS